MDQSHSGKAWRTDSRPDVAYKIGELTGGITDRLKEFVNIMQSVGVSEYTEELISERWSKLMINCMVIKIFILFSKQVLVSRLNKNSQSFFAVENHLHFVSKWPRIKSGDPFYNYNLGWNYTIAKPI